MGLNRPQDAVDVEEEFDWFGPDEPQTLSSLVDPFHGFKHIWFLERALEAARSVARVVLSGGRGHATCFLVAPNLVLTNHHVFRHEAHAEGSVVQFGYRQAPSGAIKHELEVAVDPSTFITDPGLDFTLVALKEAPDRPVLPLDPDIELDVNRHISIIQHPNGNPQQIAMRDNALAFRDDDLIQYITNTDYGSSGSPVFNEFWEVIGLHSRRVRDPNNPNLWYRNQGFRVSKILEMPGVAALIQLP